MIKRLVAVLVLVLAACSGDAAPVDVPELPALDETGLAELLAGEQPMVVNVWASWCIPCRSEAPLLKAAHEAFGDEVTFVGIDIEDTQDAARAFIAEFDLEFTNYFDREGRVRSVLGGVGVPITYFFAPGGELVYTHSGVIDERTLSLQIDEILNR